MTSCCNGYGVGLPSLPVSPKYTLHISPSWCHHIPVFTTTCYTYYCCTDSCSIVFPVENGGSSWSFWDLAIGEKGSTRSEGRKEDMPLADRVALPSAIFWTSRGHRCRPFPPPVRAFIFIAHRVQHSHRSSIFIECCLLTLSRFPPINALSKKKSLRVCALGENWTRETDFSRH